MEMKELARALRDTLISPNVSDSNGEPANLVDAVDRLANVMHQSFKQLGNADAATPMGALEAHGDAILKAAEKIADAIHELAQVIESFGESKR